MVMLPFKPKPTGQPAAAQLLLRNRPMLLYCIRHGQTIYNSEGRVQGQMDVPLSDLGRTQSEALADALAGEPIAAVYSSPLQRALRTAQPLADRLGLPIHQDPRLMEIHLGNFQGQLRCELDRRYPKVFARWKSGELDFAFPGGETRRSLLDRALAAFDSIRRSNHSHVAVVTHGALLLAVMRAMLHTPPKTQLPPLENASFSLLSMEAATVRIVRFNVVEHLRNIGLSGGGYL